MTIEQKGRWLFGINAITFDGVRLMLWLWLYAPSKEENGKPVARMIVYEAATMREDLARIL